MEENNRLGRGSTEVSNHVSKCEKATEYLQQRRVRGKWRDEEKRRRRKTMCLNERVMVAPN